ncbi:MAG: alpha/beta hydrolase [Clostridiales bacterium]
MEKKIEFYSEGCLIKGLLYLSDSYSENEKYPLVILCHGFAGFKELFLPDFAKNFIQHGFAVLTFDYRGFGESEGEKGKIVPEYQVRDIRNAILYIKTLSLIDSDKISLWGTSYGGANVITTASKECNLKCIIVQGTFGNGERVIMGGMNSDEKEKLINSLNKMATKSVLKNKSLSIPLNKMLVDKQSSAFYNNYIDKFEQLKIKIPFLTNRETLEYKPENIISNINIPILITAAESDIVNPLEESKILYEKANEPKELQIIKNAEHYDLYIGSYFEEVIEKQITWLKKYGV